MKMKTKNKPFSIDVAQALDSTVNGKGFGKRELKVISLCNAAPDMLRALLEAERVIKAQNNGTCLVSVINAISKARGIK